MWTYASAEAQVAALSDDIAYDAHDIDDGLRADLFTLDDIASVPLIGSILSAIDAQHPGIEPARRVHETVRALITRMIEDVIAETGRRVAMLKPRSAADVREAPRPVVGFSPAMEKADRDIKGFLYPRMYRHDRVMRVMADAERVVRDLFAHYTTTPADLPAEWSEGSGHYGYVRARSPYWRLYRRNDRPIRAHRAREILQRNAGIAVRVRHQWM